MELPLNIFLKRNIIVLHFPNVATTRHINTRTSSGTDDILETTLKQIDRDHFESVAKLMQSTQLLELCRHYQYLYISDDNVVIIRIIFHFTTLTCCIYMMLILNINLLDNDSLFTFCHGCCVVCMGSLLMLKTLHCAMI